MLLYNLGVRLYGASIRAASLRSGKARKWVRGRRNWRQHVSETVAGWDDNKRVWIHCASYGEFEQGRPVIAALRKKHPDHKIILTFFSPSGYEPFRDWKGADAVFYLPLDTPRNASGFIGLIRPSAVIFIKYEFWLNYLRQIRRQDIPCYLVSAVFKPHHPFFKWYGSVFRKSLTTFRKLFIQDHRSGQLLESIGITNYEITGDTRFDRVLQIRSEKIDFEWLENFKNNERLVVAGSTWASDDDFVLSAFKEIAGTAKLLLVPHDVDEKSVQRTLSKVIETGLPYCVFSAGNVSTARVMILDAVGLLSRAYSYADVAYVGGGFDGGIHNSLEPAVFGVPVTFYGNDFTKFNEAVDLLSIGAAVNVKTCQELIAAWKRLLAENGVGSARASLRAYFAEKGNSSDRVVSGIDF